MSKEILLTSTRFQVVRHTYTDHEGQVHTKDAIEHSGAVVILPVLDDGRICLIRNFRIATGETLIELPAGTREAEESTLSTALRELEEETGYRAESMKPICDFYVSPGILNERMYLFLARHLLAGSLQLQPGEQIETLLVSPAEALAMIKDGRIHDAKTITGLLLYFQFHQG